MELTLLELLNAKPMIESLSGRQLPARTSFRLARLIRTLNPELQAYTEARQKLLEKYGEPSEEDRNRYVIEEEQRPAFNGELDELLSTKVELAIEPMSIDALGDAQVTAFELLTVEWLFLDE